MLVGNGFGVAVGVGGGTLIFDGFIFVMNWNGVINEKRIINTATRIKLTGTKGPRRRSWRKRFVRRLRESYFIYSLD